MRMKPRMCVPPNISRPQSSIFFPALLNAFACSADVSIAPHLIESMRVSVDRQMSVVIVSGTCHSGLAVLISSTAMAKPKEAPCESGQFRQQFRDLPTSAVVLASQVVSNGDIIYGFAGSLDDERDSRPPVPLNALEAHIQRAGPGDTIYLEPGTYQKLALTISVSGTKTHPIVIDGNGEAIVEGNSSITLRGDWVTLRGITFKDVGRNAVIVNGSHSRITGSLFYRCGSTVHAACVKINGNSDEVDFNDFIGSRSVSLEIMGDSTVPADAFVHHNRFIDIPHLSDNGQEPIQVASKGGTISDEPYRAQILNNIFFKADGDVEAVSLKTSQNIVSGNSFKDSSSAPNIRGGSHNTVSYNLIVNSFPVRVYGNHHNIVGNTFVCPRGSSAIRLDDSWHGHAPTESATISANQFFGKGKFALAYQQFRQPSTIKVTGSLIQRNITGGMPLVSETSETELKRNGNFFIDNLVSSSSVISCPRQ